MSDQSSRPTNQPWMQATPPQPSSNDEENEVGKAILIGLLGGLLSAAGYFVYRRLPDEQRERLHAQLRTAVAARISEIRQNFNI